MPILNKFISNGVGLATEAYAHRKASKASKSSESSSTETPGQQNPGNELQGNEVNAAGDVYVEDDDEVWALDEASEEAAPPTSNEKESKKKLSNSELIQALVNRLPAPVEPQPRLPCPVILSQRRPHNKTRGFVRAYAPALRESGIDQAVFLDFLTSFEKASEASPIFNVILMGTFIAGFVPSTIVMAVTTAINAVVIPAQIAQSRYRTNNFLDDINEQLFNPRGLYCMIVSFKPEADRPVEAKAMDISDTIMKYSNPSGSKMKDSLRTLRMSSGKTYGEVELPEAAELVFPVLDNESAEKQSKMKKTSKFLGEYYDRRAQAEFLAENPNSSLITVKPKFGSSLADPTHPAYQGNLVTLLSGGRINSPRRGGFGGGGLGALGSSGRGRGGLLGRGLGSLLSAQERMTGGRPDLQGRTSHSSDGRAGLLGGRGSLVGRSGYSYDGHEAQETGVTGASYCEQAESNPQGREEPYSGGLSEGNNNERTGLSSSRVGQRPTIIGMVKKAIRPDVLYLMIVNLPTDEEIANAQAQLQEMEAAAAQAS